MKLCWDPEKRLEALVKHGLDFALCELFFADSTYEYQDDREDYNGELRMIAIGFLETELVTVVYEDRDDDVRRIISMWRATRRERRLYEQQFT